MAEKLTVTQKQRLVELNAPAEMVECEFADKGERDSFFKANETALARENREKLLKLLNLHHRPLVCEIESRLTGWLTEEESFTQVVTPIIITESMLEKMTIGADHPLASQVFWLEGKKCLRPMLAPNLYEIMREMHRVARQPIRIFEAGPCFRKETQGAQHMNEFTMLNLVELAGVREGEQMDRLRSLAVSAMKAVGIEDYELEITSSEVYGETLDIVCGDLEVASGAYGPHFLDSKWGIFDTWVGIGFGLERLAMAKAGYQNIKRAGRSLAYQDGVRLNI